MRVNVWWVEGERQSYSCCHMLNEMFDLYDCTHGPIGDRDGSVVVIHGEREVNPAWINKEMSWSRWVIVIIVGDEATTFHSDLLSHPNMKLWIQTPLPTTKADRYLIEGYTAHTRNLHLLKDLDWAFMGQDTHERRHACVAQLEKLPNGKLITTSSFGAGLPFDDYLHYMNRAKVVPCPSGPATPDSFRMAEALECGAVPIIDARSLRDETVGFWDTVLPGHPFPIVCDWAELPGKMDYVLRNWERVNRTCQYYWKGYKMNFRDWLAKDLVALGAL